MWRSAGLIELWAAAALEGVKLNGLLDEYNCSGRRPWSDADDVIGKPDGFNIDAAGNPKIENYYREILRIKVIELKAS